MLRPAVFLDRDGTLIVERDYLSDPDGVELAPNAIEALESLRRAGYALVVVTNQSGIARGLYQEADYHAVATRLNEMLAHAGVPLDGVYYCPHLLDVTGPCSCRKPGTGMYLQASAELGLDPSRSWFVGDRVTDVLPAVELQGRGILVLTGYGKEALSSIPPEAVVAADLAAAARHITAARAGRIGVDPPESLG
jgi:D-glycero-D-manno-heptose 1,7-bisphosphate phosphatase